MPDSPLPSASSPPESPGSSPAVDSLTSAPASAAPPSARPPDTVQRAKKGILLIGGVLYTAYVLWCVFLLLVLPDPAGAGGNLVSLGLLSCLAGALAIVGTGLFSLKRISSSSNSVALRQRSLIKVIAVLTPAFLISLVTPLLIIREPSFPLDIVEPANTADLIAPVVVTFSAERAAGILRNLGLQPVKYLWDSDGNGEINEETVTPTSTVLYERQGGYTAVVRVTLSDGSSRRLLRRIVIPQAVFSMIPVRPIVEKPVKFSVAGLLADPKLLKQVIWDFGDGNPAQTTVLPDIAHTYYAIGAYPVSVTVQLQNQSQTAYKRTVTVQEQPPLPFPITLVTEPATLFGPAPFGVLMRLETKEPLKEVVWSFGDGKEDRGASLLRESHAFETPGIYPVEVRARSAEGKLAELTAIVRVTETLTIAGLQFTGNPPVQGNAISGEVPLELSLTPKTSTPLVQFSWDVPVDLNLQAQGATLTGILRTEGKYSVTLLAQGAEGKSMRMPINIEVKSPSAEPTILLTPDGGVAPLTVTFDASQTFVPPGETVAGFKWLFGDEGQGAREAELGAARVSHLYKNPGQYKVLLDVVLISGKKFSAERTIVIRRPTLSACATASRLSVQAGKGVSFDSSCSTGVTTSILWDVRRDDAPGIVQAQSNDASYVYVFDKPGEYTVTLTLKDSLGNEDKKSLSISVSPAPDLPSASSSESSL